MFLKLHTIICSTRPGRNGPHVAKWFHGMAQQHGKFDAHLIDLAEFNLPIFDEPLHPRLQKYEHAHTRAWSESVQAADAFVFVTPEYNFNMPPALLNALDFLSKEWNYKPAGFVSYGGVSGGSALRADEQAGRCCAEDDAHGRKASQFPVLPRHLDEDKNFTPNDLIVASVKPMLDELHRWAEALKPMRG